MATKLPATLESVRIEYFSDLGRMQTPSNQRQEDHNRQQRINKLPSEILSQVFVLCSQIWSPCGDEEDFPVQERIPLVCRRWRNVALDTLALWTRITSTAGIPCPYVPLFLLRSGLTAPLDVTLELTESYEPDALDLNAYTQQAREAIDLIVAHGGALSRWQRLWIRTDAYYTFLAVMDLFQSSSMPSLRYLEIISAERAVNTSEGYTYPSYGVDPQLIPWFSGSSSSLCTVKLKHIPKQYLFGPVTYFRPIGLTRLEIQFGDRLPDLKDVHAMLATTCSTLTTLRLYEESFFGQISSQNRNIILPEILFPKLRVLSLRPTKTLGWSAGLLKVFKAPDLSVLRINVPRDDEDGLMQIVELFSRSSKDGHPKSYFPALTHLSYRAPDTIKLNQEKQLRMILPACHNIVSLSLSSYFRSGTALATEPWLVPKLVRLKLRGMPMDELKEIIESRNSGGIPLKTVEIGGFVHPPELRWLQEHVENVYH